MKTLITIILTVLISTNLFSQINNKENSNLSGVYKGTFYFHTFEAGGRSKEVIFPILLINDTCSLLFFEDVLLKEFSIVDNEIIEFPDYYFGDWEYPLKIFISQYEEDIKDYIDGTMFKISDLSERDFYILGKELEKQNHFETFWGYFLEAVIEDNVERVSEYVKFPLEDRYGQYYPVFSEGFSRNKTPYQAKNQEEFKDTYYRIFTDEVKNNLKNKMPRKIFRFGVWDTYNIDVYIDSMYFRKFKFEKCGYFWLMTDFPYLE